MNFIGAQGPREGGGGVGQGGLRTWVPVLAALQESESLQILMQVPEERGRAFYIVSVFLLFSLHHCRGVEVSQLLQLPGWRWKEQYKGSHSCTL